MKQRLTPLSKILFYTCIYDNNVPGLIQERASPLHLTLKSYDHIKTYIGSQLLQITTNLVA